MFCDGVVWWWRAQCQFSHRLTPVIVVSFSNRIRDSIFRRTNRVDEGAENSEHRARLLSCDLLRIILRRRLLLATLSLALFLSLSLPLSVSSLALSASVLLSISF